MQIHEVTRKTLNELVPTVAGTGAVQPKVTYGSGFVKPAATPVAAPTTTAKTSGSVGNAIANSAPGKFVTGTAAVAGGIGSALGSSLMSRAFGGIDVNPGGKTGPVMNRAQALKMGQDMARTLMPVMMKNWQSKVQTAMAQSIDPATKVAPTSASRLTSGEQSRLKSELVAMVNQAIQPRGAFDYTKLANYVGDTTTPEGQTTKATAQQAVQEINQAIENIFRATLTPNGNPSQDWQDLVVAGIAPAQGILQFDAGTAGGHGARTGAATLTPQQQNLANQMKLTDADILSMKQASKDPSKAALLAQMLGLTK